MTTPLPPPKKPSTNHLSHYGYLFGHPIAHSLSPLMHQTVYDSLSLNWRMYLLESLDMPYFLHQIRHDPALFGSAVTMPHKVSIIPFLDELTSEGRDVGAVNTIFFKQDKAGERLLCGTNTDVAGIREAFYQNVRDPDTVFHGRPGMVIGGGGAARSAVYALARQMRCRPIYIVNREPGEVTDVIEHCKARGYGSDLVHLATVPQAEGLEGVGAIVACVPDFPPRTAEEIEARAVADVMLRKTPKGALLEMCYHGRSGPFTELAALATERGWEVILGTEAMIYQGLEQERLWTGRTLEELPVEKVKITIAEKLKTIGL